MLLVTSYKSNVVTKLLHYSSDAFSITILYKMHLAATSVNKQVNFLLSDHPLQ